MTPVEILRAARKKIERPENWCQGAPSLDAGGFIATERACRWCGLGAVWAVADAAGVKRSKVDCFLDKVARQDGYHSIPGKGRAFACLNDATDHATVLRAMDRAIALAEQEAQP